MQDTMQPVQQATLNGAGWITMIFSLVLVWGGRFMFYIFGIAVARGRP